MTTNPEAYWFVGATWAGDDQSERFIADGIWENGYETKYTDHIKSMQVGERIAIKASYTRKNGLPFDNHDRAVSVMGIKAVGKITGNPGDGRAIHVQWERVDPVREWYFFTYMAALWKVVPGSSWYADELIAFTFEGQEQDYDRFRNEPFWRERYGDQEDETDPRPKPNLELWPINKQSKALPASNGYQEGYREAVSFCLAGVDRDEFVESLRNGDYFSKYTPQSCRSIFSSIKRLGLVEHRDNGLWYPTAAGDTFLEEEAPDSLTQKIIESAFGFAHTLRYTHQQPNISRNDLFEKLRELYPQWTTNFSPGSIVAWAKGLGLINDSDGRFSLTPYGTYWYSGLPEELPEPPRSPIPIKGDEKVAHSPTIKPWPTLQHIKDRFANDPETSQYVFSDIQIQSLHHAWHCLDAKRFVILSGLSGTGKTALLRHYARLYCELAGVEPKDHAAVIAVSPDWRDPSGLLGYLNALHADPTFQAEPGLRVVLGAARNPELPYFLILDEMNMARVERYFAPFLSAMEIEGSLVLHSNEDNVNDVPPSIPWPKNLFVGGTVNMDETTHPFSDKVLDRAFTFEFWDVDLQEYFERQPEEHRNPKIERLLVDLQEKLNPIRRHFGYRVAGEILAFIRDCTESEDAKTDAGNHLLDQAIFSKILPRLRGEESPALIDALKGIEDICRDHSFDQCVQKIESMRQQLVATGITRFWS